VVFNISKRYCICFFLIFFSFFAFGDKPFISWRYRAKIRVKVALPGALTNFPALVQLGTNIGSFSYLQFNSPTNGADLRFSDSSGSNVLYHEIERWDTNGQSVVWVRVPLLEGTNSYIYAYWGKAASMPSYTTNGAVWAGNFRGVWHLDSYGGNAFKDSTANNNNGVNANTDDAVGLVGGCRNVDQGDYISVANSSSINLSTAITIEAVVRLDSYPTEWNMIAAKDDSGNSRCYGLWVRSTGDLLFSYASPAGTWYHLYPGGQGFTLNAWHHIAAVMNADKDIRELYIDGRRKARDTSAIPPMQSYYPALFFGSCAGTWPTDGKIDEVRISDIDISSNRIWATWLNIASNGVFFQYYPREYQATGLMVIVRSPFFIGATNAEMSGEIVHTGNAENPKAYICWDTADRGSGATGAWAHVIYCGTNYGVGEVFSASVNGLVSGGTYFYRCYVTNSTGMDWSDEAMNFTTISLPVITNTGATNIWVWGARLRGTVLSTGGENPSLWFYHWGEEGGSTDVIHVGTIDTLFWYDIGGLEDGYTYYYKILASNVAGKVWSTTRGFTTITPAHRLYVATNGNNMAGTNWATAYRSLQSALDAAASNDVIYMAGHRFTIGQTINWNKSYIRIRGGYEATNASGAGRYDFVRWPTSLIRTGSNYRVFTINGVKGGALEGVRVINGYAYTANGGGASILNSSNFVIRGCVFTNNRAYLGSYHVRGGGIYSTNSYVEMDSCEIRDNKIYSYDAWDGGLQAYGGGLYIKGGRWQIKNTIIANNKIYDGSLSGCAGYGGGASFYADVILHNCAIIGNSHRRGATEGAAGSMYGGGIYVEGGSLSVSNCTIANNDGDGIRRGGGVVNVRDSILWHNNPDISGTMTLQYCDISDGSGSGQGCFSSDPRFERGLYLAADSPCRDAGGRLAGAASLANRTTATGGEKDRGVVDIGWHYADGISSVIDYYVATNGIDSNAGTNWATALRSISKALFYAVDGSRIYINTGRYTVATETFPLNMNKPGLQLIGVNRDKVMINASGANKNVLNVDGVVGDGLIRGIYITGGYSVNIDGGGIHIHSSELKIEDSYINTNRAINNLNWGTGYGGGIYSIASYVVMSNCEVEANQYVNAFTGIGGGIYISGGNWRVRDTIIRNNRTSSWYYQPYGGGIYIGAGTHSFTNCVIHGNDAYGGYADGLHVGGGSVNLANCTVLANLGHGIYRSGGSVSVRDSIVWGNGDDVYGSVNLLNSCIEDGDSNGTNGCFMTDPLLEYGYYLSVGSGCIDGGSREVSAAKLTGYTTSKDGIADSGMVDVGYHYKSGVNPNYVNLYVSPAGSDMNSGTNIASPLRTIKKALTISQCGTKIHVAEGLYTTNYGEIFPLLINKVGIQILGTNRENTIVNAKSTKRVLA